MSTVLPTNVLLLIALAVPACAVHAQVADDLTGERTALERMKRDIDAGVGALNADCNQVDARDAGKVAECAQRNAQLRNDMDAYGARLAAYRCRSAAAAISKLKKDIADNQTAIRNIGLGTTIDAYEQLEEMTKEQKRDFEAELLEATFAAFVDVLPNAAEAAAATGTAQGRHYAKMARDLGIDNPHVLEAIDAFSKAKGKPARARAFGEAVSTLKQTAISGYHGHALGAADSAGERAWQLAAIALAMSEEVYPELADALARRFPAIAVGVARKVTVTTGTALAAPAVSFAYNMRQLGYSSDAVAKLDISTDQQLRAVNRLHDRMKDLVARLKTEQGVQQRAGCGGH